MSLLYYVLIFLWNITHINNFPACKNRFYNVIKPV